MTFLKLSDHPILCFNVISKTINFYISNKLNLLTYIGYYEIET